MKQFAVGRVVTMLGTGCLFLTALAGPGRGQAVTPVAQVDLNQFSRSWTELARLPDKREKTCASQGLALIAPSYPKTQFQLVQSCRTKDGYTHIQNARGFQDKAGSGKLSIRYLWPFKDKYWVLALGPNYEWALVGSPNHKNLWIYSSAATLPPETFESIKSQAAAQGFPVGKLILVPQGNVPVLSRTAQDPHRTSPQ